MHALSFLLALRHPSVPLCNRLTPPSVPHPLCTPPLQGAAAVFAALNATRAAAAGQPPVPGQPTLQPALQMAPMQSQTPQQVVLPQAQLQAEPVQLAMAAATVAVAEEEDDEAPRQSEPQAWTHGELIIG